eukprot:6899527-Pyramimonas_sp.AAC.1
MPDPEVAWHVSPETSLQLRTPRCHAPGGLANDAETSSQIWASGCRARDGAAGSAWASLQRWAQIRPGLVWCGLLRL